VAPRSKKKKDEELEPDDPSAEDPSLVDDDDDAPPFTVGQFIDPAWKPPAPRSPTERKVTNKFIPLFPDATKDPKRYGASIKVHKSTPPGDGYKGTIDSPETVDEAFLASLYGDGIYKLELLDQQKNVLRVRDNVKIAAGGASSSNGGSNGHGATNVDDLIAKLTAHTDSQIQKVLDATEKRLVAEQARLDKERETERERSKEHTGLMTTLVKGEAEQLRAHYAAQQAAADASGKMLLAMLQQGHAQQMQMMQTMHEAQASRSDPLLFLKVFQEGMQNAPEDGTSKVVGDITKGLGALRDMAVADPKRLPSNGGGANGNGSAKPAKPNPSTPATANGSKKQPISKEELREIVMLKKVLRQRGMTDAQFLALVRDAKEQYADPEQPIEPDDDDELEGDEEPKRDAKPDAEPDAAPAAKPADAVDGAKPPDA
jgi:hypothetical protein